MKVSKVESHSSLKTIDEPLNNFNFDYKSDVQTNLYQSGHTPNRICDQNNAMPGQDSSYNNNFRKNSAANSSAVEDIKYSYLIKSSDSSHILTEKGISSPIAPYVT